jgi:hypothetical protein
MTVTEIKKQVSAAGGKKRIDRYTLAEVCLDRTELAGFSVNHVADEADSQLGRLVNSRLKKAGLVCLWRPNVWQIVVEL